MATQKNKAVKEHPALKAVRESGTGKVKVAVSDIDGVLRGKYLHIDKVLGAAQPHPNGGFGFCDVVFGWDANDNCYDNATLTGWRRRLSQPSARQAMTGSAMAKLLSASQPNRSCAKPAMKLATAVVPNTRKSFIAWALPRSFGR